MRRRPSDPREPGLLDGPLPLLVLIAVAILLGVLPALGQSPDPRPSGREIASIPALNFDADEGFGDGAVLQLVDYGRTGARPYRALVQPTLFRTTRGRQDVSRVADAPALLPGAWRLTAFAGVEDVRAAPYYGVGNETAREAAFERTDGAQYYRYERRQARLAADLQRGIAGLPVRALVGQFFTRTTATWREYLPVGDRLVVAARATAQQVEGDVPFHELSTIRSSWRQSEGIGGAGDRIRYSELAHDLHAGYDAGLRLHVRPSVVVGADVGHSRESTAPVFLRKSPAWAIWSGRGRTGLNDPCGGSLRLPSSFDFFDGTR